MKLLGSVENKITKDKNSENVTHLEIKEVVLVHCNMVTNDYQQDSRVLYTFVPNKPFGSLLGISSANHIFLKTFNSEYNEIEVWFIDQNSKPLEIENRINLTMVKMRYSIEARDRIYVKRYEFLFFAKNIGRNLSNKYGQKIIDTTKKSAADSIKTTWKRAIQKTVEATDDLICNKTADKITGISKKPVKLPIIDEDAEIFTHKKRYISAEERQQIIDELRLIP